MSDWDDDEPEAAPAPAAVKPAASRFADEDADGDDVKDDWDASDEEAPKTGPAVPAGPIRKKGITKQKIAEREAAEKAEAEARAAQEAEDADPALRRRREQAAVLAADMDNLSGLLGSAAVNGASDSLFESNAQSKDELAALAERLAERVHTSYGSRPLYADFIENLVKSLCTPLKDLQVRKASSALSTLANEMQAAQRATAKGGKKKAAAKPTLSAPRGGIASDTRAYSQALDVDAFDGDDDFM